MKRCLVFTWLLGFTVLNLLAQSFPDTSSLDWEGDLADRMVTGIDRYLNREIHTVLKNRSQYWDFQNPSLVAYHENIKENRKRLKTILGVVDDREETQFRVFSEIERLSGSGAEAAGLVARGRGYDVYQIRWNVFRGVHGEGYLLNPHRDVPVADVVVIPDCDDRLEEFVGLEAGNHSRGSVPQKLAERGCRVFVPFLIDRGDRYSGLPGVRNIKMSQRETLWRAAYQMGRTPVAYEIQKVLSLIDWVKRNQPGNRIGIYGFGEGGRVAFFASALDTRIDATVVSGYFRNRDRLHEEPIDRNIWSFTERFGDAEVAGLIYPRSLVIEAAEYPETEYPGPGKQGQGAAPGRLSRPSIQEVRAEFSRVRAFTHALPDGEMPVLTTGSPHQSGLSETLEVFLEDLGLSDFGETVEAVEILNSLENPVNDRLLRQYREILEDTQTLMRESPYTREKFWSGAGVSDIAQWQLSSKFYRNHFHQEIIGKLPEISLGPNPRSRKIYETDDFTGYQVVLDVYPEVFAYGVLLLPKNIPDGEKRPVVICQHGLEGRPADVADPDKNHPAYHAYACRLAERGFITFSPQNPYIGKNTFRQVLRKAQPLKLTLFSFIVRQHQVILDWLATLPAVDSSRMGFYGLSYGGKTAMRVPVLLDRYCLSICSADYNEWIWKNVDARSRYSYLYTGEYDMPEFNLGNTFNYAEMSWLIFPRPFMVERGHLDGVAPDEWVAYEYAKTRRHYVLLGKGDKTAIEFFNGPHSINGKQTFEFLHKHLKHPKPRP
jgi:dienelactone hydrolase